MCSGNGSMFDTTNGTKHMVRESMSLDSENLAVWDFGSPGKMVKHNYRNQVHGSSVRAERKTCLVGF